MSSMEPSSSGSGVEQTLKDGLRSDDKLSAADLKNLPLRSETILDSSTEKVADRECFSMNLIRNLLKITVGRQWRGKTYDW